MAGTTIKSDKTLAELAEQYEVCPNQISAERSRLNNPYSPYGSPFSNQSATNPFATNAPRLSDQQGNYRGKLSANPYDADSTSNPYGRYGSPFSQDSINNPYGAGNPYRPDSPSNPYGRGLRIEGR